VFAVHDDDVSTLHETIAGGSSKAPVVDDDDSCTNRKIVLDVDYRKRNRCWSVVHASSAAPSPSTID
jgi:hypothetical protein